METREDDDIFKYDQDPKGWTAFFDANDSGKSMYGFNIVSKVSKCLPEDAEVQFQSLKLFVKYAKI